MTVISEAIDCDVHPSVPSVGVLLPYLEEHWRDHVTYRGFDDLELTYAMWRNPFSSGERTSECIAAENP